MQKITAFKGTITATSEWLIEVKSTANKQLSLNVYGPWTQRLLKKQAGTLKSGFIVQTLRVFCWNAYHINSTRT
jgi:hypothetical protein